MGQGYVSPQALRMISDAIAGSGETDIKLAQIALDKQRHAEAREFEQKRFEHIVEEDRLNRVRLAEVDQLAREQHESTELGRRLDRVRLAEADKLSREQHESMERGRRLEQASRVGDNVSAALSQLDEFRDAETGSYRSNVLGDPRTREVLKSLVNDRDAVEVVFGNNPELRDALAEVRGGVKDLQLLRDPNTGNAVPMIELLDGRKVLHNAQTGRFDMIAVDTNGDGVIDARDYPNIGSAPGEAFVDILNGYYGFANSRTGINARQAESLHTRDAANAVIAGTNATNASTAAVADGMIADMAHTGGGSSMQPLAAVADAYSRDATQGALRGNTRIAANNLLHKANRQSAYLGEANAGFADPEAPMGNSALAEVITNAAANTQSRAREPKEKEFDLTKELTDKTAAFAAMLTQVTGIPPSRMQRLSATEYDRVHSIAAALDTAQLSAASRKDKPTTEDVLHEFANIVGAPNAQGKASDTATFSTYIKQMKESGNEAVLASLWESAKGEAAKASAEAGGGRAATHASVAEIYMQKVIEVADRQRRLSEIKHKANRYDDALKMIP